MRPRALRAGDRVAVVALSSPPDRPRLDRGLLLLHDWGLVPELMPLGKEQDYLVASDEHRLEVIRAALDDPGVAAVWAARGGYGIARIADRIRFPARKRPPLLVGFSDVSLLLASAWSRAGWVGLHGPNVSTLARVDRRLLQLVRRTVFGAERRRFSGMTTLRAGQASGMLLPMNLSLLTASLGTPLQPRLEGCVLVIEDSHEAPYRIDRMLTQLSAVGAFAGVRGLVLGDLEGALDNPVLLATVKAIAARFSLPCVSGLPVGHGKQNVPVPVGVAATLDAERGVLTLDEPMFADA